MASKEDRTSRNCDPAEHARPLKGVPVELGQAMERAARLFRALGDAPRLRIAARLLAGDCCVGDLAEAEGEAMSTISQRLRILHTENVVVRRRRGKHVNYALTDTHMAELVRNALAHASEGAQKDSQKETK